MPFTPFHFGLGYTAAGLERKPKYFSFFVFVVTQVVIDVETLKNMLTGAPRLHTFFHTFLGSTVAAAISGLLSYGLIRLGQRLIPIFPKAFATTLYGRRLFPFGMPSATAFAVSSLFGAWSHVLLDAVMHSDLRPFAPFSNFNSLEGLVSVKTLLVICSALFIPGFILISNRKTNF